MQEKADKWNTVFEFKIKDTDIVYKGTQKVGNDGITKNAAYCKYGNEYLVCRGHEVPPDFTRRQFKHLFKGNKYSPPLAAGKLPLKINIWELLYPIRDQLTGTSLTCQ